MLQRKSENGAVSGNGSIARRPFNGAIPDRPGSGRASASEIKQLADWLISERAGLSLSDNDFEVVVSAILSSYIEQRVNELVEKQISASLMMALNGIGLDSGR